MPDQTPKQREAALKLADELHSAAIDSRLNMKPICLMMDGAKAIRDLHAENVRLREALDDAPHEEDCAYIGSLLRFDKFNGRKLPSAPCNCWKSRAALSGSPATED